MTALTRALRVNALVAYLDGRERPATVTPDKGKGKSRATTDTVEVEFVPFENGEEGPEPIRLLYRYVSALRVSPQGVLFVCLPAFDP